MLCKNQFKEINSQMGLLKMARHRLCKAVWICCKVFLGQWLLLWESLKESRSPDAYCSSWLWLLCGHPSSASNTCVEPQKISINIFTEAGPGKQTWWLSVPAASGPPELYCETNAVYWKPIPSCSAPPLRSARHRHGPRKSRGWV